MEENQNEKKELSPMVAALVDVALDNGMVNILSRIDRAIKDSIAVLRLSHGHDTPLERNAVKTATYQLINAFENLSKAVPIEVLGEGFENFFERIDEQLGKVRNQVNHAYHGTDPEPETEKRETPEETPATAPAPHPGFDAPV